MANYPKVSIGMPVYNGAGFISRTLDSVLGQTFGDLEVVVIDNASTDETPDIVRRIAAGDPRVRYERNDRNIGIPRNFERAYRRSRGTYFKWHAHDDLLAPTFLERCVEVLDTIRGRCSWRRSRARSNPTDLPSPSTLRATSS